MEQWLFRMQIREGKAILRERLEKTKRMLSELKTLEATPNAMLPDWWPQTDDDGVYSDFSFSTALFAYSDVLKQMIVKYNFQVDLDLYLKSKQGTCTWGKYCTARKVNIEYTTDDGTDRIGIFQLCSQCSTFSGSGLVRQDSCDTDYCRYAICKKCVKQKGENECICPYCTKQAGKIERKDVESMKINDIDYDELSYC